MAENKTKGKNIGISQPRKLAPRKQLAKSTVSYSANNRDDYNMFQIFPLKKRLTYNVTSADNEVIKQQTQFRVEANVGQLDRLNRLKAKNK